MAKRLTKGELRIIEESKREGAELQKQELGDKKPSAWVSVRSMLLIILFFGLMVLLMSLIVTTFN